MENTDTGLKDNLEDNNEKENLTPLNVEIENSVDYFLKNRDDIEISEFFSQWILNFIEQDFFKTRESVFKLYDVYEVFNQALIKSKLKIKGIKATTPTQDEYFNIESKLIEILLKKAVDDMRIFHFINSSEWNDLRETLCKNDDLDHECIDSLEKMIIFFNLIDLKISKFGLKNGW